MRLVLIRGSPPFFGGGRKERRGGTPAPAAPLLETGCPQPALLALSRPAGRSLIALLLALAGCGGDGQRGPPPSATVAYIVTSCRQTGSTMTLQQEVRILRGDAEAVTAVSVGPLGPFAGLGCAAVGATRKWFYQQWGPLQRFGITPDGSGIVYELSDEFVTEGRGLLPPEQRRIYHMRADGSGLRPLGPASRSPTYYVGGFVSLGLSFDLSGQQFTFVDRGPDEDGQEAAQLFVQGLTPGELSRQVTHLPTLQVQWPDVSAPVFLDARTISFNRHAQSGPTVITPLLVDVDGRDVRKVNTVALPGGQVVPIFSIVGAEWVTGGLFLDGEPANPSADARIFEVFVFDGTNLLQVTNFRRTDTGLFPGFYSARDRRVYLTASADPFGTNPTQNCQIFSIDPVGGDLRQLTFFRESAAQASNGCRSGQRPNGCRIDFSWAAFKPSQNPYTGTIFFKSTCDPFRQNLNGQQLFAMQPDGSGLRQLTNAGGAVRAADGTIEVETVDAFWSAPY